LVLRFQPGMMGMMPRMMPESTSRHLRAANRELLLAVRSLIDRAIERTEQPEEGRRPRRIEATIGGVAREPEEGAAPEQPGQPGAAEEPPREQ
jgi:hypothetical protein